MAKVAICDNCGATDDWFGNSVEGPYHSEGAIMRIRENGGGREFEHTLDLCEVCKDEILNKFPKLKAKVQNG